MSFYFQKEVFDLFYFIHKKSRESSMILNTKGGILLEIPPGLFDTFSPLI
jgi:hypothetical protein